MQLDHDQERAVELIATAKMAVITGSPGTGKTTCLTAALKKIAANGESPFGTVLCAPTGKAARRMKEVTGVEAFTIHRLLGYTGDHWDHDADNPLPHKRVIVDEASMVDVELCARLFDALEPDAKVIFIGDADQLPAVQPGYLFGDLINSGTVPVVRLQTLHRAAQKSWVNRNAQKLIRGHSIELKGEFDDFVWFNTGTGGQGALVDLVDENSDLDIQVLIPQKKGPLGVYEVNRLLQRRLNHNALSDYAKSIAIGPIGQRFKAFEGDRVINTKNNYRTGVMNGEIGTLVSIFTTTAEDGSKHTCCTVDFDGHHGTTIIDNPKALNLAYALTIHKSQGSEWPWVVVVCHSDHNFMLCRQLIYTGITRAREGVILLGNEEGVARAIKNNQPAKRKTMLKQLLTSHAAE